MLRLHPSVIDYVILGIYVCVVLGIGFVARLAIKTISTSSCQGVRSRSGSPAWRSLPSRDLPLWTRRRRSGSRAANRFDIRRLIGGVFIVYSVILIALGIFGSSHVKNKAAGIIDLRTGIGMLIFGALMTLWALSRPTAGPRSVRPGAHRRRRTRTTGAWR